MDWDMIPRILSLEPTFVDYINVVKHAEDVF